MKQKVLLINIKLLACKILHQLHMDVVTDRRIVVIEEKLLFIVKLFILLLEFLVSQWRRYQRAERVSGLPHLIDR